MDHFTEINLAPPSPPLLNVVAHRKSSNTKAYAKNVSQILANNTNNGGKRISLRICVKYCSFRFNKH